MVSDSYCKGLCPKSEVKIQMCSAGSGPNGSRFVFHALPNL